MSRRTRRTTPVAVAVPAAANVAVLQRQSRWLFVGFALAAFVAFWPSYFSRLADQGTFHAHTHGLAMTLWCGLLIAQGSLIRRNRRALHRRLGSLSYVLVPVIAMTTLAFIHFRMAGQPVSSVLLHSLALGVNAVVAFVVIYALAMYHCRTPALHARYMVCTIFPLFTPVTDRLIVVHLPSLIWVVPRIDGVPVLPVVGFLLADAILLALWIWDWRSGRRLAAFPIALGVLALFQVSVLTFHRLPAWRAFGIWFTNL